MNLKNIFGNLIHGSGKGITFTHEDRDDEFCSYDELRKQSAKLSAYLKKMVSSVEMKYLFTVLT